MPSNSKKSLPRQFK